jgi:hypothetical protein
MGVQASELRFDLMGVDSVYRGISSGAEPSEVRIRVAGRTASMRDAIRIGNEVETLYTNGPAGGGGAWKSAHESIAVASVLLPRTEVHPRVSYEVVP